MPRSRFFPEFPGFSRVPWALVAAAVTVCAPSAAWALSTSPGPLARSHAKLEGPDQCLKCHTEGKGAADPKCLKCHQEARDSSYHDKQARASGKPCSKCHRDHRGRDFRMIRWRPDARFEHGKTGFMLRGKHAQAQCAQCHKRPGRWMGLQQACKGCHTDPHKPTLGGDCASCHDEKGFSPARGFDHDKARFPLRGKHKKVACKSCHRDEGSKGVYRGLAFKACADCHDEPVDQHSRGMPCDDCHMETGFSEVSRANALKLHARTRMPLRASHERLDCRKCHQKRRRLGAARTFEARLRLFAGLQADCGSCHKEPHDGRLGKDCAACHAETKFTDTDDALVRKVHSKTGFSLRGKHRRVKCSGCHAPSGDFQHRFRATQGKRCTDCHYDPHGAFKSVKGGDACETCHSVNGFAPASFDLDSHAQTRFALRFAHRVVPCSKCHPQTDREDNPRLQIAQLIGIDSRCLGCHGQPHDRQFETREPALECWVCHRETNFADLTFDHQQSRFPLQGAHQQARCDQCHVRPPTTAKTPAAVRFTGTPTRCEQCHVDPHRGQFVRNGPARKCEDCHTIRSKFVIPRFAHDKTRFALEGKHAQVGCDKCHRKVDVAGQQAVLYRMGPTPCEHCHENPHERGAP